MMRQYRLVWDFMVTVIGEKYLRLNFSFSKAEVKAFLMCLQEQDDWVASWSESTIERIGQILVRILIETGYLDNGKTDHINLPLDLFYKLHIICSKIFSYKNLYTVSARTLWRIRRFYNLYQFYP